MNKWSLGYEVLRFFVKLIHDWFYRRIVVLGKENIPKNKPVVFAPNHQNALMDPLAVIFTNPLQTVFLTRSDIFRSFLIPIFSFLKMLPVYRIRDGAASLKQNEKIFNASVEILEHNMSMALFPEALHFGKRSLRPLKKAIPRIVFQAENKNKFDLDIQVVPVGIYYDNYTDTNSLLQVAYGKPIALKDFEQDYLENDRKAQLKLRDAISEGIKPQIIHIEDLENYELIEVLRYVFRKRMARTLKIHLPNKNWFRIDQITIETFNKLEEEQKAKLNQLFISLNKIYQELGLKSYELAKTNWAKFIVNIFLLILGLPIYLFAFINNFIPIFWLKRFLKKNIKDPQFHSSLKFGFGLLILPIYYLLISLIPFFIMGDFYLSYFLALVVSGLISVKYKLLYQNTRKHWALIRARIFRKNEYRALRDVYYQMWKILKRGF